jgi:heme exporter protein D
MTPAFASWHDFWLMGGYAAYVWLAVGATLLPLLILLLQIRGQRKALLREIAQHQARQRRRSTAQQWEAV